MPETRSIDQSEADFLLARAHPIASLIMEALGEQDARTYHGDSGNKGALALTTAEQIRKVCAKDERHRLACLLEEHALDLTSFVSTPQKMLDLIVWLLQLDHDEPAPEPEPTGSDDDSPDGP